MTAVDVHAFEVTRPHATLRGEWAGTGSPVVLLHAGICDRRMWEQPFAALAESRRVIRYDLRGFGDSIPAADDDDRPFAHHDDLLAVLDRLGVERATLVGASFGGRVAIDATLAAPSRVAALVTIAAPPTGWPWDACVRAVWPAVDDALDRGDVAVANERELRLWVDGPRRGPGVVDPELRAWVGAMNAASLASPWTGSGEQPLDPPAAGRLPAIGCPVLAMVGELDVPGVIAAGEHLAHAVPGATLARFPDAGHLPSLEDPDRFQRELERFLSLPRTDVAGRQAMVAG